MTSAGRLLSVLARAPKLPKIVLSMSICRGIEAEGTYASPERLQPSFGRSISCLLDVCARYSADKPILIERGFITGRSGAERIRVRPTPERDPGCYARTLAAMARRESGAEHDSPGVLAGLSVDFSRGHTLPATCGRAR